MSGRDAEGYGGEEHVARGVSPANEEDLNSDEYERTYNRCE